MQKGSSEIIVKLNNQTNQKQTAYLFAGNSVPTNPLVLTNSFTYDFSSLISNNIIVLYVYYSLNGGAYQVVSNNFGSQITNVTQIINWLNTLGIGTFYNNGSNKVAYYTNTYTISSIQGGDSSVPTVAVSSLNYNTNGTLLYNTGYAINGVGGFTLLPTNTLWKNFTPNLIDGRFNNAGTDFSTGGTGNSSTSLPISSTNNQLYFGFSYANLSANPTIFNVYLNNTQILNIDTAAETAMNANIDTVLSGVFTNVLSTFWHIFPITTTSNSNVITIEAGSSASSINIGFEVYNNTSTQLQTATNVSNLNILNSALTNGYYIRQI